MTNHPRCRSRVVCRWAATHTMAHGVQFIVCNGDEQFGKELRSSLLKFEGVKIVADVKEVALLRQAVDQLSADILLVNLDPTPESVLPVAGEISAAHPDLAVFAVSASNDSELILTALRAGLREFLPRPIDMKALSDAIERVASTLVESTPGGRLITVSGCSGGIGTTMLATNLAVELGQMAEGRVTVVDLDYRFGQVATVLDLDPTYSLADLCHSPEQLEQQVIDRALVKHSSGIYVLSRPLQLEQADSITASACVGLLSSLLQYNEYVITDGPSRFEGDAQAICDLADDRLLLVQLLVPSVRNALRAIQAIKDTGSNLDRTKLVCNRLGRESGHLSMEDVTETLGLKEFATIPDDWSTVSGAINLGEPLLVHSPKSKVRSTIHEMAERLHTANDGSDDNGADKKGLLGRIFAST